MVVFFGLIPFLALPLLRKVNNDYFSKPPYIAGIIAALGFLAIYLFLTGNDKYGFNINILNSYIGALLFGYIFVEQYYYEHIRSYTKDIPLFLCILFACFIPYDYAIYVVSTGCILRSLPVTKEKIINELESRSIFIFAVLLVLVSGKVQIISEEVTLLILAITMLFNAVVYKLDVIDLLFYLLAFWRFDAQEASIVYGLLFLSLFVVQARNKNHIIDNSAALLSVYFMLTQQSYLFLLSSYVFFIGIKKCSTYTPRLFLVLSFLVYIASNEIGLFNYLIPALALLATYVSVSKNTLTENIYYIKTKNIHMLSMNASVLIITIFSLAQIEFKNISFISVMIFITVLLFMNIVLKDNLKRLAGEN